MNRAAIFLLAIIATMMALSSAMPAISVVASVRGKKYDVSDVETVDEFTQKVEGLVAGMETGQSSVLFRGKVLSGTDNLEEAGVANGDGSNGSRIVINCNVKSQIRKWSCRSYVGSPA